MIEDNHDDDELPLISVNAQSHVASNFTMPSAEVLATQRAREEECKRELMQLRRTDVSEDLEAAPAAFSQYSDSSCSEAELTLTANVNALRVHETITTPYRINMIEVTRELLDHLPKSHSQFFYNYFEELLKGNSTVTQFVNNEVLSGMEAAVRSKHSEWAPSAVLCCCAWLCVVCASGISGEATGVSGLRLRRTLHALLQHADDELADELARVLCAAARSPRLLLELSDVVQGASGAPARLARALLQRGLDEESGCSYTRVQLAGRLAAAAGAAPPALPAAGCTLKETEQLKVAVGAVKLELLLRERK